MLVIISDVAIKLLLPELCIAFRSSTALTPLMAVPKTPMDKDNGLVLRQHNIGFTRQVFSMEPKPVPHPMKHGSYDQFRLGVIALDLRM